MNFKVRSAIERAHTGELNAETRRTDISPNLSRSGTSMNLGSQNVDDSDDSDSCHADVLLVSP